MYIKPGYLLYASEARALVARRFDLPREEISQEAIPVVDRVWYNEGTGRAVFSASHTGVIAYREPLVSRLQWISRTGANLSASRDGTYHSFAVASDYRTLASQLDPVAGRYDVWLYDPKWAPRRLTFDSASDLRPVWSADESAAVFSRQERGGSQLYEVKLDRPGVERPLLPRPSPGGLARFPGTELFWSTRRSAAASPVVSGRSVLDRPISHVLSMKAERTNRRRACHPINDGWPLPRT
jgi:hypothetical protein